MSSSLALLPLLLAVQLPPHGRVNSRCYTAWNSARTNLEVVWDGARYSQPWTFSTEVSTNRDVCQADGCVQRLWCTDSGAAGRYTVDMSQSNWEKNQVLAYTWLRDTSLRGSRVLAIQGRKNDAITMTVTNAYGPGTLLVMGSTLFFYTIDYDYPNQVRYGHPYLTSLVFAEYSAGKTADQLMTEQLTAFDVLGYSSAYSWYSHWSPIYPAGAGALTISVEDYNRGDSWAVDVSLSVSGGSATRKAMVHLPYSDVPSIRSASREVLTVPGFSCRAYTSGTAPKCYRIGESATKYTWASTAQTALGWTFTPLSSLGSFALPSALWLHDGKNSGGTSYRLLATYGLGSIIAFSGSTFYGVESLPDASCASGRRLFLLTRAVPSMAELRRTALACEWHQVFPAADYSEVVYGATAVKWLGPWQQGPLFVATDIERHEYHMMGEADTSTGDPVLEHVYRTDERSGTIRLGALSCYFEFALRVPTDIDVLRSSVARDKTACARYLLERGRARADDVDGRGQPLLLHAETLEMVMLLADHGADIEAKNGSGWTSLMAVASRGRTLKRHLARGAAVCTWPLSVFDAGRAVRVNHLRWPCEPGFWLGAGANCTGLTPCEEGHFCPGHREQTNEQRPCPAGTYGPHPGMASLAQCRPCPPQRPRSPPGSPDASWCGTAEREAPAPSLHVPMPVAPLEPGEFDSTPCRGGW